MAKYSANPGLESISLDAVSLAAPAGAGSEFALIIPNHGTPTITWATVFSAPVGSVTVNLEASLDGINWFVIDSSTAIAGEIKTKSGSFRFIRINNSAVTVGAGITLTASFVQSNQTDFESLLLPPLLNTMVVIPTASVLDLINHKILIPAIPGKFIVPEKCMIVKQAGTIYTIVGLTSFSLGWSVSGATWGGTSAADISTFLETASLRVLYSWGGYNRSGVSVLSINPRTPVLIGASVDIFTLGASPAAGTGDLNCYLTYRVWDEANLNW